MRLLHSKLLSCLAPVLSAISFVAYGQPALNPLTGYTGYHERYSIPYSNNPGYGTASPGESFIKVKILDTDHDIILDTGSRGLYVSQNMLPVDYTPTGFAGDLFLSSSKRLFQGTWDNLAISFPQATGYGGVSGPAQATLPVLVVQSITAQDAPATFSTLVESGIVTLTDNSTVSFSGSQVTLNPGQVAAYAQNVGILGTASNFGVGIDPSGTSTHPNNTDQYNQQFNAFLNLDQMKAGTMWAGYRLDQTGVHVGLTEDVTGYAYTNLIPTGLAQVPGSPPDWQIPTGTVTYNGTTHNTGRVLVDIGIDKAYLTLPGGPGGVVSGNYTVNLLNSNGAVSFEVNGHADNILNPSETHWSAFTPGPFSESQSPYGEQFLNTGRNVVNGFDLLYDAQGGLYGMKPNATIPHAQMTFAAGYYPSPIPVPEPATTSILVSCGGGWLFWRIRRKQNPKKYCRMTT